MTATETRSSTTVHGALLFTDLAGFTAFTSERGDAAALALVERFEAIVTAALPGGGRVVKQLGDGLFLFVPTARDAVSAAWSFSERCASESSTNAPLWVRTGVHVGSAIARGDDLIGHDVNIASRITALAAPSEVLVSDATRRAVEQELLDAPGACLDVLFETVGPVFVKGIDDPIRLSRVLPVAARDG